MANSKKYVNSGIYAAIGLGADVFWRTIVFFLELRAKQKIKIIYYNWIELSYLIY